ncbi:MAG: alkaline phosphatase PhoX, partial [Myxococcota bacterium]|nr:alkaline phosphatase PhoX [Myxococcota bacterium]
NINHYFRGEIRDPIELVTQTRMKIPNPHGYEWFREDERFNCQLHPTEPNRFGWVVEINPFDPESTPKKRTALGRFFHESANPVITSDGRVVIYMGDDTAFEHLYRFVSTKSYVPGNAEQNADILDSGELSAAVFDDEGGLRWVTLIHGVGPLNSSNGFNSQADVLIDARRAARLMGATPMDRPEDVEVSHHGDRIYVCLTKNPARGTADNPESNSANPRNENFCGHIIEISPPKINGKAEHHSERMSWDMLLMGGRPEDGGEYGPHHDGMTFMGCPDNACLDPLGRLWVTTDGAENSIGCADGIYAVETGAQRGRITRLFASPIGAEVTGPCFTKDGISLFASVQHPGLVAGFDGAQPVTRWPDFDPAQPPRPAVVVIQKKNGAAIG